MNHMIAWAYGVLGAGTVIASTGGAVQSGCAAFHSQPATVQTVEKVFAIALVDGACLTIEGKAETDAEKAVVAQACAKIDSAILLARKARAAASAAPNAAIAPQVAK
jgi:hypothetical protein